MRKDNPRWIENKNKLIASSALSNGLGLMASCLFVYFFWSPSRFIGSNYWLTLSITIGVLLIVIPHWVQNTNWSTEKKYSTYNFSFKILLTLCPVLFLYPTLFFFKKMNIEEQTVLIMILAGCAAGSVVSNNHSKTITITQILGYFLPLIFIGYTLDTKIGFVIGSGSIIYTLVLVKQTLNLSYFIEREFDLTDSNIQLLEENKKNTQILIQNSKMASLGRMAGGIAHEINNPLAIISASIENLEYLFRDQPTQLQLTKKYTDKMQKSMKRIVNIINGLKRISQNERPEQLQVVNLCSIVNETLSLTTESFKKHNIKLFFETGTQAEVIGEPVQISQVLLNLLNNSCDALLNQNDKWIRIDISKNKESIYLSVINSGPPIAANLVPRIMDPFFSTKEIGQGTGLGLSISNSIMKQHGGSLHYDIHSENPKFDMVFNLENS